MPCVRTVFYNFTKHETAFDFTSKGPLLLKGTNTKHNFFPVQERSHGFWSEGFQETCSPWVAQINPAWLMWTNRCYLNIYSCLSDAVLFYLSTFRERERTWRAPDLSALKLLITAANLFLLSDSLKSAPPNGTGLTLHSHLAWQEVEEGRRKMEKENGKNKDKYGRKPRLSYSPTGRFPEKNWRLRRTRVPGRMVGRSVLQ